jgi:isocitrate lyase
MVSVTKYVSDEEAAFQAEVAAVKKWWTDSRWRHTKRPFTAEQIVSKRGTITIDYVGNQQSQKLWGILESRFKVRLFFLPHLTNKTERRSFCHLRLS